MKEGWENITLSGICENLDSKRVPITKNKRIHGNVPYYGASGIVDYVKDYLFDEDLLLISEDGANLLARTYPIAFSITGKTWVNNHAHVLRFDNSVTQQYVEYYMNSISLESYVSGMAQPKLNQRSLNSIIIPIPPLPEQKAIVKIIDEAFAKIDQAKANIEKNIENAKELFRSRKEKLFEELSTKSKKLSIPEICEEIFAGGDAPKNSMSKEKTEKYNVPIIANAVKDNGLYGYTTEARVLKPSITIAARGSGTGHTEIRNYPFLPIVRLIVLTPKTDIVNLEFLRHAILNLVITSSGSAIPQLTIPMIKTYNLPIPDLKKQESVVNELSDLKKSLDLFKQKSEMKLSSLVELKKSLLQKAFSGELTKSLALA